jgi:FtsH-binding integral membrane protein
MNTNPLSVAPFDEQAAAQENARFMSKVYTWMMVGVALTAVVAYAIASRPDLAMKVVMNRAIFYGLLIAQIGAVIVLSAAMKKLNAAAATAIYLGYAAIVGVTFSVIFFVYTQSSIMHVFAITAVGFAGLSAFGYATKRDLGPVGSFCMMGLFGMVGFALISIFFPSVMTETASKVYGIVGIIVFSGLTAYDTQRIKAMNVIGNEGTAEDHKEAIYGALKLYLDFINLFLSLLRIFGKRR